MFDDDDGGTHGTDSALRNMGAGSAIDPGTLLLKGRRMGGDDGKYDGH